MNPGKTLVLVSMLFAVGRASRADEISEATEVLSKARKITDALLHEEKGVSVDDLMMHYTSDIVYISRGETTVGIKLVAEKNKDNIRNFLKLQEQGFKFDIVSKIENSKKLTDTSVLITRRDKAVVTIGEKTIRSEFTAATVLVRHGDSWKIAFETTSEQPK